MAMDNYIAAGVIGGITVAAIAGSALVFGMRGDDGAADKAAAPAKEQQVAAGKDARIECDTERVVTRQDWGKNAVAGTVIGGVAGGALGHQIGDGSGQDAATVAGAMGGAYVGNRIAREQYPDEQVSYQERCREVRR